jgi:hypothetical protein
MDRTRLFRFSLLAGALVVGGTLLRHAPRDQVVHYVLGDSAVHVQEVDARWREMADGPRKSALNDPGDHQTDDWTRTASFRYAPGKAPRVVTHEPRLPNGDYMVEIEIIGEGRQSIVRREVTLSGGATSIDLATGGR